MGAREDVNASDAKLVRKIRLYQILLLVAVVFCTSMVLLDKRTTVEFASQYPLIDPARDYIDQEHFITNIEPLRIDLNKFVEENGGKNISVYFEYLNTGANISVNNDVAIWPASLAKLPLAMGVMKKIETKKWKLDDKLILSSADVDSQYGELYKQAVGSTYTIEYLLTELLVRSDNTAYKILLRNMDYAEVVDIVNSIGLDKLFTEEGKITSKEYSRIYRALYTSSYLTRESSEYILDMLTKSSFDQYLKSGLPPEVKFAHKIGENKDLGAYSDSGIVYLENRPYMITVMIQTEEEGVEIESKIQGIMKQISEKSYKYVSEQ